MDFELSEEHKMFQTAIRDFAEKEIAPLVKEAEETETFPIQLFPKLGGLGYLCPGYPEEYGGGGLGKIGDCILIEELCRLCCYGIGQAIMTQTGTGTYSIFTHGNQQQKQKYLVQATKGQKISAYALTEPNVGSDAGAIETTARKEGDHYIINGSKMYITNGAMCDYALVFASTDRSKGARGICCFIVDRDTPGFKVNKLRKMGAHSNPTGELVFEDCHVPAENLVGEEGKGFRYALETLNGARISHGARSLGTAEAAYEASLSYAKERIQFGHPIGGFQAIAFKLSNMVAEIEAARSFLYRVAWLYDQGNDCRQEAPMVKLFCSEVAIRAAEQAMRIHASAAVLAESDVHRYFRDAILQHSTEGTTEIMQLLIAQSLGLPV